MHCSEAQSTAVRDILKFKLGLKQSLVGPGREQNCSQRVEGPQVNPSDSYPTHLMALYGISGAPGSSL